LADFFMKQHHPRVTVVIPGRSTSMNSLVGLGRHRLCILVYF